MLNSVLAHQEQADQTAAKLAKLIAQGRERGKQGRQLRNRLDTITKQLGERNSDYINGYLWHHYYSAISEYATLLENGRSATRHAINMRSQINKMGRILNSKPKELLHYEYESRAEGLADEYVNTKGKSKIAGKNIEKTKQISTCIRKIKAGIYKTGC